MAYRKVNINTLLYIHTKETKESLQLINTLHIKKNFYFISTKNILMKRVSFKNSSQKKNLKS